MRLSVSEKNIAAVISACVVLHNICEDKGLVVNQDLMETLPVMVPPPPPLNGRFHDLDRRQRTAGQEAFAVFFWFFLLSPCTE